MTGMINLETLPENEEVKRYPPGKTGLAIWCRWCCCRKCAGDGKNAENREDGIE